MSMLARDAQFRAPKPAKVVWRSAGAVRMRRRSGRGS
jgi:hypothetical protein